MKYFAYTLFVIGILNFAAYCIISLSIGGDAINGKTEGGKFYLGEHGRYKEVSSSVFEYSRIHTYSVWVTHPLAMFGAFLLIADKKRQGKISRPAPPC